MISRLFQLLRKRELDCNDVRAASSDFVDEELTPSESARVRSHLDWCVACAAFVNTLRATINMLRSTAASESPDGFTDRIRRRIIQETGV